MAEPMRQLHLLVDSNMLEEVDRVLNLARKVRLGSRLTRSDILREAIAHGLAKVSGDLGSRGA